MNEESDLVEDLDRLRIKEERVRRNNIKKTEKKLERKRQQEQKDLQLKMQPIGGNVSLITQDFVDKITKKHSVLNSNDILNDERNFPTLGKLNRTPKRDLAIGNSVLSVNSSNNKQVLSLGDFINAKTNESVVCKKLRIAVDTKYSGNPLDSDVPIRKRGKFREVPKPKRFSALKREINRDMEEYTEGVELQKLSLTDIIPNIITNEEIDNVVSIFITRIVELQEKLFKRDSIKGKYKRRYVVGFHETKKYLNLNKVKVIVIATDVKLIKKDDAMSCLINEIIELCKKNEVLYLFALKRKKLGIATLKYIPVSCMTILNYEGAEEQLTNIKLAISSYSTYGSNS
ncbi:hypothetical protein RN001_005728 [Aquatica leii]|uniref:Ribosomal protein eL8/eL30/eS12/Gadd45 domain-containing protein n=1 Tax=Aquatica leii TaxID=1421715 RepID=A0AAN7Q0P4_9COLE|nr:hypothetical protein RN001_005728 [Aquatica leii]